MKRIVTTAGFITLFAVGLSARPTFASPAVAPVPHAGRLERSTPGLVPETGARTAACDQLRFTRDGGHLLAAGDDKVVRTWAITADGSLADDPAFPVLRWPVYREQRGNIYDFDLSPDETKVAVAGFGQNSNGFSAAVVDRASGKVLHGTLYPTGERPEWGGVIWSVAYAPGGDRVALGTDGGSVWIWDLSAGPGRERLTRLGGHAEPGKVLTLAYLTNGELLSASATGEMIAWPTGPAGGTQRVVQRFSRRIESAEVSPDGAWVAAVLAQANANAEYEAHLLALAAPRPPTVFRFSHKNSERPHRLAFARDGRRLAIGLRGEATPITTLNRVGFYQERSGRVLIYALDQADVAGQRPTEGPKQGLYAERLAFDPVHPNRLAVAGGDHHDVELWDWKAGERLGRVDQPGRCLWGVAISGDGDRIAFQADRHHDAPDTNQRGRGPWYPFDLKTRELLRPRVGGWPFEPDATGRASRYGWEVVTHDAKEHRSDQWRVRRPARDGRPALDFPIPLLATTDEHPRCYVFLPPVRPGDPERLAVGHYWGASIFELTPGGPRKVRTLRGHEGYVSAIAVSSDGTRLVTASRDMTAAGWAIGDRPVNAAVGAELYVQDGRVWVGNVGPGTPLWEMGLTKGDEILALHVPDIDESGRLKGRRVVYDTTGFYGQAPSRQPNAVGAFFGNGLSPNLEHLFVWRTADGTVHVGVTSAVDRPVWKLFPQWTGSDDADGPDEWVLWRWRDFYYDCSTNGDFNIGWQHSPWTPERGMPLAGPDKTPNYYRAEQFRETFQSAEQVAATMAEWSNKDLKPANFIAVEPPQVTVSTPVPAAAGYTVSIEAVPRSVVAANHQPDEVLVWLNDYLLARLTGKDLAGKVVPPKPGTPGVPDGHGPVRLDNVRIPADKLRTTGNVVFAQCYNRGGVRGDSAVVELPDPPTPVEPRPRTLHALLIGVGNYSRSDLTSLGLKNQRRLIDLYARGDAGALESALTRRRVSKAFDEVRVETLLDHQVTPASVRAKVAEAAGRVHPDDVFVCYLGGHGLSLPELTKLGMPDSALSGLDPFLFLCGDFHTGRPLRDTTVGFADLRDRLHRLPCHKLVLLDACHSGAVKSVVGETAAANPVRVLAEYGVGSIVMAACAATESALESPALDPVGGSGLFIVALTQMLSRPTQFRNADGDGDGVLTTSEIKGAVVRDVAALVGQLEKLVARNKGAADKSAETLTQTPIAFVPKRVGNWPIAQK